MENIRISGAKDETENHQLYDTRKWEHGSFEAGGFLIVFMDQVAIIHKPKTLGHKLNQKLHRKHTFNNNFKLEKAKNG